MPADCIGTAVIPEEAALIGEPHNPRPAGGWPAAAAGLAPDALEGRPRGPGETPEQRRAFSLNAAERVRSERPVIPAAAHPAIDEAVQAALAKWDEMEPLDVAHRIADKFDDPDCHELEEQWLDAEDRYGDTLAEVLALRSPGLTFAMDKVCTYAAGHGFQVSAQGELIGRNDDEPHYRPLFQALWRDLVSAGEQACPAARLFDEHEPIYAKAEEEHEFCLWGPGSAYATSVQYEERASWARARSLRGAMYQVALAASRNDIMISDGGSKDQERDLRRRLDHRFIGRLLMSTLYCLADHVGCDLTSMLDAYAGPSEHNYIDLLSDDPQPFDAAAFVAKYEAAGGRLSHASSDDGACGIANMPPREPGALKPFLKDLCDPTRAEAIAVYVDERSSASVNAQEHWLS